MFCKKCGNKLENGQKFCAKCGQAVEETLLTENDAQQEVTEQTIQQDTVVDSQEVEAAASSEFEVETKSVKADENFAEPYFSDAEPPRKNVKSFFAKIATVAVAVILVAAIVLNFGFVSGAAVKLFGSDEAYYRYVEKRALAEVENAIIDIYGGYVDGSATLDTATSGKISLNIDDDIMNLLKTSVGDSVDISFIEDIAINFDVNSKDKMQQIQYALALADKNVLTVDVIYDLFNSGMYVGIPELSEDYLSLDMSETEEVYEALEVLYDEAFYEALPSKNEFNKLMNKYVNIVIDNIDDVSGKSKKIRVNGIQQNCTVLEYEITEDDLYDIAEAILKEAKEDSTLEKIIIDIQSYLENEDVYDYSGDLYDDFKEFVEDTLDEIDEYKDEADDEEAAKILTYVNSKHEIIGREISFDGEAVLYYATARDGKEFATEFIFGENELVISGKGTEKRNIKNCEYTVAYDDVEYAVIELVDFNTSKIDDGIFSGSISIKPTDDLLDELQIDSPAASLIGLSDIELQLVFDSNKKDAKFEINVCGNEKVLFGIVFEGKQDNAKKIKLPEDTVDANDEDAVSEWAQSIDFEALKDSLEEAGVPSEIISIVEYAIESQGSSSYDDYYDDYTYDDYYYDDYDYSYDDYNYDDYDYSYDDYDYYF